MNEEKRKLDGMESSKSKRNTHRMHGRHERNAQVKLEPRCGVRVVTTRTWLLDFAHMGSSVHHSRVEVHVRCVEGALGLGGHVVIGVVLGVTTQTQYQVQSSSLLDFVVLLWTCSQTVFCDRQLHLQPNYCTLASRKRVI